MQDVASVSAVKLEVARDQLDCHSRKNKKLDVDKSKDKQEPTRMTWDPHLSPTTSSLNALRDLEEIPAPFTTKLHTHICPRTHRNSRSSGNSPSQIAD